MRGRRRLPQWVKQMADAAKAKAKAKAGNQMRDSSDEPASARIGQLGHYYICIQEGKLE